MFRFALVALVLIAFGSVLAGAAGAAGTGLLVLASAFIVGKILLILLFLGAVSGFFWRSYDSRPRSPWARRWRPRRSEEPKEKSRAEQFDEWHRESHARDEVDTWVEDLD